MPIGGDNSTRFCGLNAGDEEPEKTGGGAGAGGGAGGWEVRCSDSPRLLPLPETRVILLRPSGGVPSRVGSWVFVGHQKEDGSDARYPYALSHGHGHPVRVSLRVRDRRLRWRRLRRGHGSGRGSVPRDDSALRGGARNRHHCPDAGTRPSPRLLDTEKPRRVGPNPPARASTRHRSRGRRDLPAHAAATGLAPELRPLAPGARRALPGGDARGCRGDRDRPRALLLRKVEADLRLDRTRARGGARTAGLDLFPGHEDLNGTAMELRYCEECGDVIQVETSTPGNISDHFVCERCKSGAGAPRPEAAASEDVQAGSLNLFSPETIAIRKKKIDEDTASKKPKSSRLKLVKANEEAEPRLATDPPRATVPPVASPAPVADPPQPAAEPVPGSTTGSASPAKSARRILFRCLHCRSTLSIRPVEKTSKLTCPHCTNVIYVTPTGRLLKNSPSVALRKGEVAPTELLSSGAVGSGTNPATSVVQRNPASVAIKKTGSVVVSKAGVRKTGSNVGLRNTAFKEQQQAAASQQPSARFQRPAADGAAPPARKNEVPLKDIPMASINPATSWMPKPASAFREHEENQDPGKTAFLTEERTGDLSDLTSSPALAGVAEQFALPDLRNAPPAPSPRLGALLPADGE